MPIVVVQLSDIHIQGPDDPVLLRGPAIAAAVSSAHPAPEAVVLAYCGDIAFSGTDQQYLLALTLVASVRDEISARFPKGTVIVEAFVPGNHDCDFSASQMARHIILDDVLKQRPAHVAADVVTLATAVQDNFFGFLAATGQTVAPNSRLYYETHVALQSRRIRICCLNTSWMSRLKETQALLYYPHSLVPDRSPENELVISLLHHPYNWLASDSGRQVRARVEALSDIVLTGHEHTYGTRGIQNERGEAALYIEAAPLQEHHARTESAFQVLVVDADAARQRLLRFDFAGDMYASPSDIRDWEPLQALRFRSRTGLVPTELFQSALDDLGVVATHPKRRDLRRRDLFTYPDLRRRTENPRKPGPLVRGESLSQIIFESEEIAIVGPDKCGKTTLAKQLVEDLLAKGCSPVLIDCANTAAWTAHNCLRHVDGAAREQYGEGKLVRYQQLNRAQRVVLLDNFHRIRVRRGDIAECLAEIGRFAGHVVVISNEMDQHLADLVNQRVVLEDRDSLTEFHIQPFGHLRRNEYAERWLMLDDDLAADPERFAREILRLQSIIDLAVGRNFVPAYPIFVLPMLQAFSHSEAVNVSASTYGYYYESLISTALAAGGGKDKLDLHRGFLTFFARSLFDRAQDRVEEADFLDLISKFRDVQMVMLRHTETLSALVSAGMLASSGGQVSFRYAYIYYYFVALSLRDRIDEPATRAAVTQLVGTIHEEPSANTLLFLVHLTKHSFVVDLLVSRARGIFTELDKATLSPADSPLAALAVAAQAPRLEDGNSRDYRREALAGLDNIPSERAAVASQGRDTPAEDSAGDYGEVDAYLVRMTESFKVLQILGQVAVNFPGTIEGPVKLSIVRETIGVGLRSLASMIRLMEDAADEVVQHAFVHIRAESRDLSEAEIAQRVRESVTALPRMVIYGIVRRIAYAIGSPLLEPVYDQVEREEPTPAVRLIAATLRLEQMREFPEAMVVELYRDLDGNPLARTILCGLVVHHMRVFGVRFDLKQRVCAALGIEYGAVQGTRPRALLVKPKA